MKASSPPASTPGSSSGSSTFFTALAWVAPRSRAASSSVKSKSCRRPSTTIVTKLKQKVTCAIQMVSSPVSTPVRTNNASSDMPMRMSGMTSGRVMSM